MPRKRAARPLTKAQRRRGLGVLITGLTSELEQQQQLLTQLQQEHLQLRSSHDILVGYCDALEFGLQLERARHSLSALCCKDPSTEAAADGSSTACQGAQNSRAGGSPAEQQLLAELAQLHYSAQPLYPQPELARQQQQQQQQQQDGKAEDEPACRKLSAQSSSSRTATYYSKDVKAEDRISPPEDQFLLFRWLLAQPVWPDAEHVTAAGLVSDLRQTLDAVAVLLQQLGETVPTHYILYMQQREQQQQLQPQPAAEQQSYLQQQLVQHLNLQQPQQPATLQQADQQHTCAKLQLPEKCDTAQMRQQSNKLPQGSLLQEVPQAPCMQQQQRQRHLNSLRQVIVNEFVSAASVMRLGRGHLVSQLCMTNLQTGELMKECNLDHFRAHVRQAGLSQQQLQDISQAQRVFESIHAPILQEVRQLQQELGLAELPASGSMLSHLTRTNSQRAQLDRLLLLQNKGSMLRNCFAYHVFGYMSWVQWGKLSLLLWPYPALAAVVAQAVSEVVAEQHMQDVGMHKKQQQPREDWALWLLSGDTTEQQPPTSGI